MTIAQSDDTISLFPIEHYDQTITTWLNPLGADYDQSLLSEKRQQEHMQDFYAHYFGERSPWNNAHINKLLKKMQTDDLKSLEQEMLNSFDNEFNSHPIIYGENFRPYNKEWINAIADNINLTQFTTLIYEANQRGIAIDNLHARALPTDDVGFYNPKLAGEGFPFDNLQVSALWAGTPVYILGTSRDHAWMLVLTPDYIGWVKSKGIARVSGNFVAMYLKASQKHLAAITETNTKIIDHQQFLFNAYIGSVFPALKQKNGDITLLVPIANFNHEAILKSISLNKSAAEFMPLKATPHHFAKLFGTLLGRPYGWGNLYFYNDCSGELKNLYTPFGIYLPRHSSNQVAAGLMVDLSKQTKAERIQYLQAHGKKLMTIVYIGGHVVMYVGDYPYADNDAVPLTYQNVWGLHPTPSTRRAVIGKSVFLPMLAQFQEDPTLNSQASYSYFQVSYLDSPPATPLMLKELDVKSLLFPENSI